MKQPFKVPACEIEARIQKVQKALHEKEIHGLFIVQRVDLFYFSGTAQNGFLYIPAEGEPLLLVKKYFPRALRESSIKNIVEISSVKEVTERITDFCGGLPRVLAFEFDVIPVREFNFYRSLFSRQDCVDGSFLIHRVRMVKSDWEIEQLQNTARLSSQTFDYMRSHIRPGYTEMEFSGMIETFARKHGHGAKLRVRDYQTEAYPWHILSGKSGAQVGLLDSPASGEGTSPAFPSGGGSKKLVPGEPIMIDFSSVLNGYHLDETRMFAIGTMPQKALDASLAAIDIHNNVLGKVKPGVRIESLFHFSRARANSLGFEEAYLGPPGYKVGFVGHGVGCELIEQPILSEKNETLLEPGMVFALEPKMLFPDEFTAGIESVFVVTDKGHRLISKVPTEVFIC